jgi:hypothetical protein
MNNLQITSITPIEKRPCHPTYAKARGMHESYEHVYAIQGFSDGHIHAPLILEAPSGGSARYFRPFTHHPLTQRVTTTVTVMQENPKVPWKEGMKIENYDGLISIYEFAVPKAIFSGRDPVTKKPIWTRELEITLEEQVTKKTSKMVLKNVISWKCGSGKDGLSLPFSVRAVEMTPKEIEAHASKHTQHARLPL